MAEISMRNTARTAFLQATKALYLLIRPLIFRSSAQNAHEHMLRLLTILDKSVVATTLFHSINRLAFKPYPITVGGVDLQHPFILAAGFVKGTGFDDEPTAASAVQRGENIIPGWQSMPAFVGAVEFGSFTRWPRIGNLGEVLWRDVATHSTQNRIGLKNPGAYTAAEFLAQHRQHLPRIFGINIAVSPGIDDLTQEKREILESIEAFFSRQIIPAWFTLNLSCPNTDDDPAGNQTEHKARELCGVVANQLNGIAPLWVKISPGLSDAQYAALMRTFAEIGVKAVIATNTLPQPAPHHAEIIAGVGGGRLHSHAVNAAAVLMREKTLHQYDVDIIGCGGIESPADYADFAQYGIRVVQYWSALIYRGPLAAALILNELT